MLVIGAFLDAVARNTVRAADAITEACGWIARVLVAILIPVGFLDVFLRYVGRYTETQLVNDTWIEAQWYLCGVIFYPVAFSFAGTAITFGAIGLLMEEFDLNHMIILFSRWFKAVDNFTLPAVPFFVFMGAILKKSGLAEHMLTTIGMALVLVMVFPTVLWLPSAVG